MNRKFLHFTFKTTRLNKNKLMAFFLTNSNRDKEKDRKEDKKEAVDRNVEHEKEKETAKDVVVVKQEEQKEE